MQLRRRQPPGSEDRSEAKAEIEEELGGSGCFIGYRKMWRRLERGSVYVEKL